MDLFDVLLQVGLFTGSVVVYLIFIRKPPTHKGRYRTPGWNYPLKLLIAWYAVRKWKSRLSHDHTEPPRQDQVEGWDSIAIRASALDGSAVLLGIRKLCGRKPLAEVTVHVKLPDGTTYMLPQHPETLVGVWEETDGAWSSGGLKIQVLEPQGRLRVLYNGLLTRIQDNVTQHVTLNLIWAPATKVIGHPIDWSNHLAAHTLALEPWRDGDWHQLLDKCKDSGWLQWGALQGRFQSYGENGVSDKSSYLRIRGVRERNWNPQGYKDLRRSVTITVAARDGIAVQIRGHSYKKQFTECFSGSVRFPDFTSKSITATDLVLSDFCEDIDGIPNVYTINVSTNNRDLKVVLRINEDGGRLLSGSFDKQRQLIVCRTLQASINGEQGTGLLELGYEAESCEQPATLGPRRVLKWLSADEVKSTVTYCVSFDNRAAQCPELVGGKGASLALLASVQEEEGYRVPPGFCLTTRSLEKQLEAHPELRAAILAIEAANEDYNETNFKEKCSMTVKLFHATPIVDDVKEEILSHLSDLRKKAIEHNMGPQLRFAVRSSAVGEDSELLSAAGQNETILGCQTDEDVLLGVQKCWASMFAFTSAYYRRQNGQACVCGAGVVVQALVRARAAGVVFSRRPPAGDPARLLLTANYGLGETVVSGSVEPDTITVNRRDGKLNIEQIILGSKTQRITAGGNGVDTEDVPEEQRKVACVSDSEILRLAEIAVAQDDMWGAGRDIEWAVTENEIFLLQARPITSLERWTDEELRHEFDTPIMSDDELLTFANVGEVLPKPLSAMSIDFVVEPLNAGMTEMTGSVAQGYDKTIFYTHNRAAISLYNTIYRITPEELDVNIRMLEMCLHGHKVADDNILSVALHRRQPKILDRLIAMNNAFSTLITSWWVVRDSTKRVERLNIDCSTDDLKTRLKAIETTISDMYKFSYNHGSTSTASACIQFIAMNILLEGKSDFSPEQCSEIGSMLSSGDVLSAEVPQILGKIAKELENSGRAEEFRAQSSMTAMHWLKHNLPDIHKDVMKFLDDHGHRAIMEFDLATKPWALVPEELMKVLQQMRYTQNETSYSISTNNNESVDVIASLKSPQKSSTKKILRWVLPLCRRTVRHREGTKARLILAIHKLRLAFIELGRLMVRQWYMPHHDVIFFFRLDELYKYIETRDPGLLKKALQRQHYYPEWCKLKFVEINTGWVEPLEAATPVFTTGDVKMVATTVCGGEVIARACVVKDLSEIDQLQQGDVLITHSTDIGWSPYFPLLSGIVTELGGLISHGAVIAREYGLPCIVGATGATVMFKTGDTVRLSGTKATLEKICLTDKPDDVVEKVM